MNRRDFLRFASVIPLTGLMPSALLAKQQDQQAQNKIVVLIELQGGNDGLNTLVPLSQYDQYQAARPRLALSESQLISLTPQYGMHPALRPLQSYWQAGQMAWVQGVGNGTLNRSHFRSIEIWEHGTTDRQAHTGWVQQLFNNPQEICGIAINDRLGPLKGRNSRCLRIGSVDDYINQARRFQNAKQPSAQTSSHNAQSSDALLAHIERTKKEVVRSVDDLSLQMDKVRHIGAGFLKDELGNGLRSVSQLIVGGANVPVYKVGLSGFDTHNQQKGMHNNLLQRVANNLHIFAQLMKKAGRWDDIIVMTYSEFGRRVQENGGAGTDHGSAAAHFMLGGRVNRGVHGLEPSLVDLTPDGDLKQTVDFRAVYGTLATRWWGKPNVWGKAAVPFV